MPLVSLRMRHNFVVFVALALVDLVAARAVSAQGATMCLASDSKAVHLRSELTLMATGNDPYPQVRSMFHIPQVTSDQITIVSDSTVCASAAAAYDREMARINNTSPRSRTVYVVRIGTAGYAIQDPTEQGSGEWTPVIFVDRLFNYVSSWAG